MRNRPYYPRGFVLGVVGLGLVLSAHPQGAMHVFQKVAPSVVALIMEDDNRQPSALGSGFVVGDELIVTNFHVIRGAAAGRVKLVGDEKLFLIEGVVGADAKRDVAILRVPGLKALALPLFQASRVAVGDGVFALGSPRGLEGSFSQGIVSGIRQIGDTTLFQITAPISPGSSGGPIVEASGSVIGVAVATLQGGQNLNFAISISHIQDLLKTVGQPYPLSRVSKKKDETRKSILSEIGAPGIEKVTVSSVVCTDALYTWHCNFSVHNGLDVLIAKVRYLVILRDKQGRPVDSREGVLHYGKIRPGLAMRTSNSNGQFDVEHETKKLLGKIDVRILEFGVPE